MKHGVKSFYSMQKITAFTVLVLAAWFIYSRVEQARRETAYRAALAQFQRDLHIGMTREETKKYLDSRKVPYQPMYWSEPGGAGWSYRIQVAEEPATIVCKSWDVYIVLNFGSTKTVSRIPPDEPVASDILQGVHLKKEGTCL